uniref:Uncharacterized protein n=1 Tax=Kalanchoe fedtschenkoi TaxID=63787 RepID=A0A7N0T3Z7_KALFE
MQERKTVELASKVEGLRLMERRCMVLQQNIASRKCKILYLKSEIGKIDERYEEIVTELRVLMDEVSRLEQVEKEKDRFYDMKKLEMNEFIKSAEKFEVDCRKSIDALSEGICQLKAKIATFQGNNGYTYNSDIAEAEIRKAELLCLKQNLDKTLASNHRIRAQLQKQLQSILTTQSQNGRMISPYTENR